MGAKENIRIKVGRVFATWREMNGRPRTPSSPALLSIRNFKRSDALKPMHEERERGSFLDEVNLISSKIGKGRETLKRGNYSNPQERQ